MKLRITESDTLLNVPKERHLMHGQILALKCFYQLTWMEQSREGFFPDLLEIVMVFLTSMNPLESSFLKFEAFLSQCLLLIIIHNGTSRPKIYITALVGCFVFEKFQLFMDLILVCKALRKLHNGATRQQFMMSVVFVAAVWYFIPIETLFYLVLLYEVINSCVNEGLNMYQICYLLFAIFLMCYYHDDVDLDCFLQPMECLRRPFLPPQSNITVPMKQTRPKLGHII